MMGGSLLPMAELRDGVLVPLHSSQSTNSSGFQPQNSYQWTAIYPPGWYISVLLALKKVRATCQNVGTKRKLPHSRTWFVNATVGVVGGYTQPRVAYDADCGWVLVPSSCRFMLSLTCNVYDLVCDDQL